MANQPNIAESLELYIRSVQLARSQNTARTYQHAVQAFLVCLEGAGVDPEAIAAHQTQEDWIADFADWLKGYTPATEQLYLTALSGWYEFLVAERHAELNLPRVRLLIRRRARRPGQRLPQFPRVEIETLIDFANDLASAPYENQRQRLRNLRDRAFLLTLADTGLRVHEATGLRRGDLDWNEGRALLIGKGNRQSLVRFSGRAMRALQDYLKARAALDGAFGRPLRSLPLFARHDRGAGDKLMQISTTTGRAIVDLRAGQALGSQHQGIITPHTFRHYFVTSVLIGSGGNLKLAQELARHRNIAVTQRYAHLSDDELDRGYHDIFNTQ